MTDKTAPQTPAEAMAAVREAVETGNLEFSSDTLTAQLDAEIQVIFIAIHAAQHDEGEYHPPQRPLWVADGQPLGVVIAVEGAEEEAVLARAAAALGIPLSATDLWEEAALRLRDSTGNSTPS